jgi:hypothetical protein
LTVDPIPILFLRSSTSSMGMCQFMNSSPYFEMVSDQIIDDQPAPARGLRLGVPRLKLRREAAV